MSKGLVGFLIYFLSLILGASSFALAATYLQEKKYWLFGLNFIVAITYVAVVVKWLIM